MLRMPDPAQITDGERLVRTLIDLTEQRRFDELLRHYRRETLDQVGLRALIERNQPGHLRMLREILANSEHWLLTGDQLMAHGADGGVEYPGEDGIFLRSTPAGLVTEPFADSPVLHRDAATVDAGTRALAATAGVSPFVAREVVRLGGRFPTGAAADAIAAFSGVEWGDDACFSSPGDDDLGFIYEASFSADDEGHRPEGFARHPEMRIFGTDCYHYFGLVANGRDAGDPIVVTLDHEEEDEDPRPERYLSDWLARLHRGTRG